MIDKSKEQKYSLSRENMSRLRKFIELSREKILLSIWKWELETFMVFWKWSKKVQVMMKYLEKWLISSEISMLRDFNGTKQLSSTLPPKTTKAWSKLSLCLKTMTAWLKSLRKYPKMILFSTNLQTDSNLQEWLNTQSSVTRNLVSTKRLLIAVFCLITGT